MKIVRLTTKDPNSYFDNIFNDNLVLKPNSKIALQSLALQTQENKILLDDSNDFITYQIVDGEGQQTVFLPQDIYDENNYRDLFNAIQNRLNDNTDVDYSPGATVYIKNYGLEWKASEDKENKFFVKYEIGGYGEFRDKWKYDNTKVEVLPASGIWRQKANQPNNDQNDRNVAFPEYLARGCGFIRCRTNIFDIPNPLEQPEDNGYIVGLSPVDFSKQSTPPTQNQIQHGIQVHCKADGTRIYSVISYGTVTEIPAAICTPQFIGNSSPRNDYQEVIINGGEIEFNIWQSQSPGGDFDFRRISLDIEEYDDNQKLYPFVIFRGGNCNLLKLNITPSPYSSIDSSIRDTSLDVIPVPNVPPQVTNNFISFASSLATFLGFENPRIPQTGFLQVAEPTYTAYNKFQALDVADCFLVELLNLKVDSYDGLKEQRKNILSFIPQSNAVDNVLIYEVNNPIFIDLNNASEILLRNLRLRVVKNDYSVLEMRGEATMVLLIQ